MNYQDICDAHEKWIKENATVRVGYGCKIHLSFFPNVAFQEAVVLTQNGRRLTMSLLEAEMLMEALQELVKGRDNAPV